MAVLICVITVNMESKTNISIKLELGISNLQCKCSHRFQKDFRSGKFAGRSKSVPYSVKALPTVVVSSCEMSDSCQCLLQTIVNLWLAVAQ